MIRMAEYKIPFIFSSDPAAGARNVSADGSSFTVEFERPLVIPKTVKTCWIEVEEATVWFNTPNIITGVNDQVEVIQASVHGGDPRILTIAQGLYDLDHLNQSFQQAMFNEGYEKDVITILADPPTGGTVIEFDAGDIQMDFADPSLNGFNEIIGFNARIIPENAFDPIFEYSDFKANFNQIEYYLFHTDLVSRGIRINNEYTQVVHQALIDTDPGGQIQSTPFNPITVPSMELVGENRKDIRFWLTDQSNNLVNTDGEIWSMRLVVHYVI